MLSKLHTKAHITAFGMYVPDQRITNEDLSKLVDTNDEWIVQRTGMKERRQAAAGQYASDLAVEAVRSMESRYPGSLDGIDAILVATTTPDTFFPNTAALVQAKLELHNSMALDVSNACAGFVSAMQLAIGLLDAGMHHKLLIIGTEVLTKTVDYTDRSTCILFGDGAGAVIMENKLDSEPSFIASYSLTEGDIGGSLYRAAVSPVIGDITLKSDSLLYQNGREVMKWALRKIPEGIDRILSFMDYKPEDIDIFVPHSANLRMIESISERSNIPMERILTSVEYFGNTSAASIPLAIENGLRAGSLNKGDMTLLYGFGGGLSQAALLMCWTL